MSAPIEMRMFVRRATLQDIENGLPVQRQPIGPLVNGFQPHAMFLQPPELQLRWKEKVYLNGAPSVEWSPWVPVLFVREGDEEPQEIPPKV